MARRSLRRDIWRRATLATLCALAPFSCSATAGELSDVAADVQSNSEYPSHGCDDPDNPYDDSYDNSWGEFWSTALTGLIAVASSKNPGLEFTAYPYENDHEGYLADLANPDAATHPVSSRFWAEYGSDFDNIDLVSVGLLIEGENRLGFDLTWRTYFEDLGPEGHDDLSTGDANLLFRLFQSDRCLWRIGVGMPWMEFEGDVDIGYNFTTSADFFPLRPWIVSFEGDAGKLGHATLLHGRSTIGFNLRHAEIYTGVDHLKIEDSNVTSLVTGVRTWW